MLEEGVGGVRVVVAVTVMMVMNLPGDSAQSWVLVFTGGMMMMMRVMQ